MTWRERDRAYDADNPRPTTVISPTQPTPLSSIFFPRPVFVAPDNTPSPEKTAAAVTADNSVNTADPVVQAMLQQLEYTKPQVTESSSKTPQVTTISLPGQEQASNSGGGMVMLMILVVVLGLAYWFMTKGKKHLHHEGGTIHVEPGH